MKKYYQITQSGKKKLELELAELKSGRTAIADKISEARDFGDLSENAEYDAAREEQGLLESRIAEIEDILQNASIIKNSAKSKVSLGSTVDLKSGPKQYSYTIVGPVEADPLSGKISNESPMGDSLLDKKVGDSVTIETPKGKIAYKIIHIS